MVALAVKLFWDEEPPIAKTRGSGFNGGPPRSSAETLEVQAQGSIVVPRRSCAS